MKYVRCLIDDETAAAAAYAAKLGGVTLPEVYGVAIMAAMRTWSARDLIYMVQNPDRIAGDALRKTVEASESEG